MATANKPTKASKVRAYQAKHPNASATEVAKATGVDIAYIYAIRHSDNKPNVKVPKKDWKTVMLATSKKAVVKHLGVTMAKDDVTKLTEEQTARLVHNMTQGRTRMQEAVTMVEPQADNVNHPAHYKVGGIETIDFLEAKLTPEEFRGYLRGNILKYLSRAGSKGNYEEDMLKARWYLNREASRFGK